MKSYQIKYNDIAVGSAEVDIEGLYYKINCRCKLPGEGTYRIFAVAGNRELDLGICVPSGNSYCLVKRMPIKQLGKSEPSFIVRQQVCPDAFLIEDGQPFGHIDKLENSYLEFRYNRPYLVILKPTDQL